MIWPNYPEENPKYTWIELIIGLLFGLFICSLLSGCKTQVVERVITDTLIVNHSDTLIQERVVRDSIAVHDSVYFSIFEKGDTVFQYKYVEHTAYKDRIKHDSIYLTRVDTVTHNYVDYQTEIKEVEKKLSWWQKFRMTLGNIMMLLILGAVAYGIYYCWSKFRSKL